MDSGGWCACSSLVFGETDVSDEVEIDSEGLVHKDVSDDDVLLLACGSEVELGNSDDIVVVVVAVVVVVVVVVSPALSFDCVSLSSCRSLLVVVVASPVW